MQIIDDYKNIIRPNEPLTAALGYFDGFHLGHMRILNELEKSGCKKAVVTFKNQPLAFITKSQTPYRIMGLEDKVEYFEQLGIDYLFIYDFDEELMNITKEDYVRIFIDGCNIKYVTAGFNYTFGRNREGNTDNLQRLCLPYGIEVQVMQPVMFGDKVLSSTLIRQCLYHGEVSTAAQMLGRPFYLKGKVIKGKELGGKLGFPTANIAIDKDILVPKWGVYVTRVQIEGHEHKGVTNVGDNPTIENDSLSVETHVLDFDGDLYGRELKIEFITMIRPEQKFSSVEGLKEQVERDIAFVRNY